MPESPSKAPLVWVDCEMTGLDAEKDTILSLACYVTSHDLLLLDETGYEAIVHHSKDALSQMNDWCIKTHGDSGLTQRCIESNTTAEDAAMGLLNYIKRFVRKPHSALLAGNTVHMDRAFLVKHPYKPVIDFLGYRLLDVSSIKEAARRWAPEDLLRAIPAKKKLHDAREDIRESIKEAQYYRERLFLQ